MPGVRHLVCVLLALALTVPLDGSLGPTRGHTAVLDRFEGSDAVLVVDDGESVVVAATRLPTAGRHVDAVFAVRLAHGALTSVEYDPRETRRRARSTRERFDRLRLAGVQSASASERVPSTSTESPTESPTPTSDSGT